MLVDAASLYYRTFYGVKGKVLAPDGTPVGGARGFIDSLALLVRTRRPDRLAICWDLDWRPAFRTALLPEYKAHRLAPGAAGERGEEDTPAELAAQVPIIADVLDAVGILRVGGVGCEADDVIGTLVQHAVDAAAAPPSGARGQAPPERVEIVTGDRDLYQLVRETPLPVHVLYTGAGMRHLEEVDEARLAERYGVASGDAYADAATLRGDPSDGLPGVPGIGDKTAASLVSTFGSLTGVLAALDDGDPRLAPSVRERLRAARGYLDRAPGVVRVLRGADLVVLDADGRRPAARAQGGGAPGIDDTLPSSPRDPGTLTVLAERWKLTSPLERLRIALEAGEEVAGAAER